MSIIETCPAFSSSVAPSSERPQAACVADPLHAVVGSWLGPVVPPPGSPAKAAPCPTAVVRCDDFGWR